MLFCRTFFGLWVVVEQLHCAIWEHQRGLISVAILSDQILCHKYLFFPVFQDNGTGILEETQAHNNPRQRWAGASFSCQRWRRPATRPTRWAAVWCNEHRPFPRRCLQPKEYAVENLPGHPHDHKVGFYLEGAEILIITSVLAKLESTVFVCQILLQECFGSWLAFVFIFFLLKLLCLETVSQSIFKLAAFFGLLADIRMHCFQFCVVLTLSYLFMYLITFVPGWDSSSGWKIPVLWKNSWGTAWLKRNTPTITGDVWLCCLF